MASSAPGGPRRKGGVRRLLESAAIFRFADLDPTGRLRVNNRVAFLVG